MTILDFHNPHIDHPALGTFAQLARDYCELVESFEATPQSVFLHRVHALVPAVYAAGLALPSTDVLFSDEEESEAEEPYVAPPPDPDFFTGEPRHALFEALGRYLGERNSYREVFDPWEPLEGNPEVVGSVADDVVDIYADLRCGLRKWARDETGAALWEWRFGLENHWGQHATGVMRALHCAAAWQDVGWPPS